MTTLKVKLSPGSVDVIEDILSRREDGSEVDFKLGKTYIEASTLELCDLADQIETEAYDAGDAAVGGVDSDNTARQDFAYHAAVASRFQLSAKLQGVKMTRRQAWRRATALKG